MSVNGKLWQLMGQDSRVLHLRGFKWAMKKIWLFGLSRWLDQNYLHTSLGMIMSHYTNSHEATSISWNFYMSFLTPNLFKDHRTWGTPTKIPSTKCEYGIIEYIQKPTYLRANKKQRVESWWWRLTFAFDFWWWKKNTENLGCHESFNGFSGRNCVISFSAYLFCKRSCVCCSKLRLLLEPPPNAESSLHDHLPFHQRRVPVPHCHKKRSRWRRWIDRDRTSQFHGPNSTRFFPSPYVFPCVLDQKNPL